MDTHKNSFIIYPAIDLRQGKVVRLLGGDPDKQTTYSIDPRHTAEKWIQQGAGWLHVVNLDAAFDEEDTPNRAALSRIIQTARSAGCKVQFGGGLRSLKAIDQALFVGVDRVVVGTLAALQPALLKQALDEFRPEKIAVGLDARDGKVSIKGWQEDTPLESLAFAKGLAGMGLKTIIFTDISRDGAGQGGNLLETRRLSKQSGLEVIASGGFSSVDEVLAVRQAGLGGVILGRALYDGRLDLSACFQAVQKGA
ncbi:MAG: 1-(5-phosphoribosyl)-5-[(5-phosphoribosylamino)methylideneamino]imidazole-4-carboxamide isomerase [Anaerolineaceae bacterium]